MKKLLTWKNLGWVFTAFTAYKILPASVSKLIKTEQMVGIFDFLHLPQYMLGLGILEVIATVLLVLNKTSKYGAILITSLMSGALALHLSLMQGNGAITPVIIIVSAWLSHCLRSYTK